MQKASTSIHPDTDIGVVHLTVPDLDRSIQFYGGTLGLRTRRREGPMVELGTVAAPLLTLWEQARARPRPPHTTGLYHFAILLPSRADLARALQRLLAARYGIDGASDHLVSEAVYLADPDGNGIEIYADRPRSAWPVQDGWLRMDTLPLDLEDLMDEVRAGVAAAPGLPEGTRIGHIHLHVADLAAAEAFYRDVLGFDLMVRYGRSASFLSAGGYHHHIGINTWAGAGAPPPPPDAAGLRFFTLRLPHEAELARVVARVREAGAPLEETPGGVLVRDPSQNGVALTSRT